MNAREAEQAIADALSEKGRLKAGGECVKYARIAVEALAAAHLDPHEWLALGGWELEHVDAIVDGRGYLAYPRVPIWRLRPTGESHEDEPFPKPTVNLIGDETRIGVVPRPTGEGSRE